MSKILKNQLNTTLDISDVGATLPASPSTYTIQPQEYLLWANSSDIITAIGSGNVVVNDGSQDLSISDGTNLIKGYYPHKLVGADGTVIGNTSDALKVTGVIGEITTPIKGRQHTSFVPDPSSVSAGIGEISTDINNQLITRGTVLTDEGSFRDDFSGTDLKTALTGTVSFTNGETTVTGSGTAFSTELKLRDYIKITTHAETTWAKIADIISDTELELEEAYTGATASAAAHKTHWITLTPTGATNAISSGIFTVSSGTTNGILAGIWRHGDYPPYNIQVRLKINNRRANQIAYFGARDDTSAPEKKAQFVFDGTNNRVVKCQTSSSSNAYDLEETTYSLPFEVTSDYQLYRIDINAEKVTFSINDTIVAVHTAHLPGPYDSINMMCLIENTGVPAGSTDLSIDYMNWQNVDQVDIKNNFRGDQIPVTMYGLTDSLQLRHVPVNNRGHLQTVIKNPSLPFEAINTESLYPEFQLDAVYGLNSLTANTTTSGTGSATASDSSFVVSTGTTIYSQGVIQSIKRLRHRPGQGTIGRCSALFTSPVANSYQIAGFGHAEDGIYIGYKDTDFGILYTNRGIRETRTLTVTVASLISQNATVTLNGVAFSVPVTNGSTTKNAYEIASFNYAGWTAEQIGNTVIFVSDSAASLNGTYSISGTLIAGSFARTKAGQAATETFVKQSEWNGDRLDGLGGSGVTLDPTKYNLFEFHIQDIGAGTLTVMAEVASSRNQPEMTVLHEIRLPNTLTTTAFGNSSFPFTMAAYSAGSTTNLTVKCGSIAGFVEGNRRLQGPRFSVYDTSTTATNNSYVPLFSIQNALYYGGRANQGVINILSLTAGVRHTDVTTVFMIRNATLSAGTPNFTAFGTGSMMYIDNGATACTFNNNQLIWSGQMGVNGTLSFEFTDDITIQPGEMITVAARTLAGTVNNLAINLNIREDQ